MLVRHRGHRIKLTNARRLQRSLLQYTLDASLCKLGSKPRRGDLLVSPFTFSHLPQHSTKRPQTIPACLPLLRPVFKSMHQKVSRSTLSSPCSCWPCSTEHQPATASATTTEGVDPRVAVFENSFYITRPDPAPARARLERRRIRGILDSWSSLSSKVSSAATTNLSHLSRISRRKTRDSAVVVHHEGRVDDDVAERQATPGMVERQELSFIPVVTVADIEPSKPA